MAFQRTATWVLAMLVVASYVLLVLVTFI